MSKTEGPTLSIEGKSQNPIGPLKSNTFIQVKHFTYPCQIETWGEWEINSQSVIAIKCSKQSKMYTWQ